MPGHFSLGTRVHFVSYAEDLRCGLQAYWRMLVVFPADKRMANSVWRMAYASKSVNGVLGMF
jgi:hypothetical protein